MSQTELADTLTTTDATITQQVAMTLAALTYAPSSDEIEQLLSEEIIPPKGSLATGKDWSVVWGPATSPLSGNLMYVAYNDTLDTYAVAIRGTLLDVSLGTLIDLYEDLDVCTQVPFEYPGTQGALIANGTAAGLGDLLNNMSSRGKKLTDYLSGVVTSGTPLWVVGHSLGGCLATVLAATLQNALNPTPDTGVVVTPFTFAGPTAGNQAFADLYVNLFGDANRCFNSLDLVPMAWQDLDAMSGLYAGGPACPLEMQAVIALVAEWLVVHGVSYAQPGAGAKLNGSLKSDPPAANWFDEVVYQHNHNTYLGLLNANPVPF